MSGGYVTGGATACSSVDAQVLHDISAGGVDVLRSWLSLHITVRVASSPGGAAGSIHQDEAVGRIMLAAIKADNVPALELVCQHRGLLLTNPIPGLPGEISDHLREILTTSNVWQLGPAHVAALCGAVKVLEMVAAVQPQGPELLLGSREVAGNASPLEIGCAAGHSSAVKLVLELAASKQRVLQLWPALVLACSHSHVEVIHLLLRHATRHGAAPPAQPSPAPPRAPPSWSSEEERRAAVKQAVQVLTHSGSSHAPAHGPAPRVNPLLSAVDAGSAAAVKVLQAACPPQASLNEAVVRACSSGGSSDMVAVASSLLGAGAAVNAALLAACRTQQQHIIQWMATDGRAQLKTKVQELFVRVAMSDVAAVEALVAAAGGGCSVNSVLLTTTPLCIAAGCNDGVMVQKLLDLGGLVDGRTAADMAAAEAEADVARDKRLYRSDEVEGCPLAWAARRGARNIVEKLIDAGADVGSHIAVVEAVWACQTEVLSLLLSRGAHVGLLQVEELTCRPGPALSDAHRPALAVLLQSTSMCSSVVVSLRSGIPEVPLYYMLEHHCRQRAWLDNVMTVLQVMSQSAASHPHLAAAAVILSSAALYKMWSGPLSWAGQQESSQLLHSFQVLLCRAIHSTTQLPADMLEPLMKLVLTAWRDKPLFCEQVCYVLGMSCPNPCVIEARWLLSFATSSGSLSTVNWVVDRLVSATSCRDADGVCVWLSPAGLRLLARRYPAALSRLLTQLPLVMADVVALPQHMATTPLAYCSAKAQPGDFPWEQRLWRSWFYGLLDTELTQSNHQQRSVLVVSAVALQHVQGMVLAVLAVVAAACVFCLTWLALWTSAFISKGAAARLDDFFTGRRIEAQTLARRQLVPLAGLASSTLTAAGGGSPAAAGGGSASLLHWLLRGSAPHAVFSTPTLKALVAAHWQAYAQAFSLFLAMEHVCYCAVFVAYAMLAFRGSTSLQAPDGSFDCSACRASRFIALLAVLAVMTAGRWWQLTQLLWRWQLHLPGWCVVDGTSNMLVTAVIGLQLSCTGYDWVQALTTVTLLVLSLRLVYHSLVSEHLSRFTHTLQAVTRGLVLWCAYFVVLYGAFVLAFLVINNQGGRVSDIFMKLITEVLGLDFSLDFLVYDVEQSWSLPALAIVLNIIYMVLAVVLLLNIAVAVVLDVYAHVGLAEEWESWRGRALLVAQAETLIPSWMMRRISAALLGRYLFTVEADDQVEAEVIAAAVAEAAPCGHLASANTNDDAMSPTGTGGGDNGSGGGDGGGYSPSLPLSPTGKPEWAGQGARPGGKLGGSVPALSLLLSDAAQGPGCAGKGAAAAGLLPLTRDVRSLRLHLDAMEFKLDAVLAVLVKAQALPATAHPPGGGHAGSLTGVSLRTEARDRLAQRCGYVPPDPVVEDSAREGTSKSNSRGQSNSRRREERGSSRRMKGVGHASAGRERDGPSSGLSIKSRPTSGLAKIKKTNKVATEHAATSPDRTQRSLSPPDPRSASVGRRKPPPTSTNAVTKPSLGDPSDTRGGMARAGMATQALPNSAKSRAVNTVVSPPNSPTSAPAIITASVTDPMAAIAPGTATAIVVAEAVGVRSKSPHKLAAGSKSLSKLAAVTSTTPTPR